MKNKNVKLGIFFVGGLIIFIALLYVIGSKQNMFESNIKLSADFSNAIGLQEGSAVRFIGITIGYVDEIFLAHDTLVNVTMQINKSNANFITRDAHAVINSDGLMGNKIITILPGDGTAPSVQNGDQIPSKKPVGLENVMNSVLENSRNLEELTSRFIRISEQISAGRGLVGRLLYDTLTEQQFDQLMSDANIFVENMNTTTSNLKELSDQIAHGDGTLSRLINDSTLAVSLEQTLDSINHASGNLKSASAEFKSFSKKLNNGPGAISRLVNDTTMAEELKQTIINARERSEELEETIEIVNDSWILNVFSKKNRNDEDEDFD